MVLLGVSFVTVLLWVHSSHCAIKDNFWTQSDVDFVKKSQMPTLGDFSRLQRITKSFYPYSFSLLQAEPPLGQLTLYQPLPTPLIRKGVKVDDICLVFSENLQMALYDSKLTGIKTIGSKIELFILDLSEPCGDSNFGFSFKSNSHLYQTLLNNSTDHLKIDISNLHPDLLPDTDSSDWFKLLVKTSSLLPPDDSKNPQHANWAENILVLAGRYKRELENLSCGEETSCCGVITKMPMKDVLLSMQLISQETLVVSPAYYTTMQCKGWCASKYLHSYPDNFPGCRPSKYSNGSVLLKIEATQNSTQEMYPHFREHHFVNWNVSDCGCV